uniref:Uncharacterized protein n=1 Tax=Chenopodium quinoa TaxID=63459 RepID=A0A803MT44_CHEQI
MINLFRVKAKQKENAENLNGKTHVKKQSAGELRLHKDISELNLPKSCTISFPNGKDDLMNFEVTIRPDEGYYLSVSRVDSPEWHKLADQKRRVRKRTLVLESRVPEASPRKMMNLADQGSKRTEIVTIGESGSGTLVVAHRVGSGGVRPFSATLRQ